MKSIILFIAEAVDKYSEEMAKLISFAISIFTLMDWIQENNADLGEALALAALVFFIIRPILEGFFILLLIVPQFICHFGLLAYEFYQEIKDDGEEGKCEEEWRKEDRERKENADQKENNSQRKNNDRKEDDSRQEKSNRQKEKNSGFGKCSDGMFSEAVEFFGLQEPFSEVELREKYHKVIKKIHPDAGGNTEETQKANQYYSYLKTFCNGK